MQRPPLTAILTAVEAALRIPPPSAGRAWEARLARLTTAAKPASDQAVNNEIVFLANVLLNNSETLAFLSHFGASHIETYRARNADYQMIRHIGHKTRVSRRVVPRRSLLTPSSPMVSSVSYCPSGARSGPRRTTVGRATACLGWLPRTMMLWLVTIYLGIRSCSFRASAVISPTAFASSARWAARWRCWAAVLVAHTAGCELGTLEVAMMGGSPHA